MKIIVTHSSPDWDAISSSWFIKRYLPGWENAEVQFVPAGQRIAPFKGESAIEKIGDNDVIHVDTGMGPLDHHQTSDKHTSAASLSWEYVQQRNQEFVNPTSEKMKDRIEAITRMVNILVDIDHFGEVFWENPAADYHEFSLLGILEGLKVARPNQDSFYVNFGFECLDALLHEFENRVWAENEIKKGLEFTTSFGKAIAFETINDTVIKLSQKMGYVLVVRKDPRKGYVRIKARPQTETEKGIDLTLAYEQLSKMDPNATWFLHVSKKMLLNGTPKNPKMVPTTLTLKQIVDVVKTI
ncbi:MAG TPA: hypothetical protein VF820_07065 [Patescibacteria group bacterium]